MYGWNLAAKQTGWNPAAGEVGKALARMAMLLQGRQNSDEGENGEHSDDEGS